MKSIRIAGAAAAGAIMIAILAAFGAQTSPPIRKASARAAHASGSTTKPEPPSREKVLNFVRERFGVVSTTQLTLSDFQPSADPDFLQATITSNDPKSKPQDVSVSKDGRYLCLGPMTPLPKADPGTVTQLVRDQFKLNPSINLTATDLQPSKYPGFLETKVTASDGTHTSNQSFYVTSDKKFLSFSNDIYRLDVDPRKEVLRTISLKDQPMQGAVNAPVTIVEYADLECPSCARMHQYLESDFMPKYGSKVRIVFKEFPLPMHEWSRYGAVANECAYQMDPSKYVPYRTLIFEHQNDVDAVQANSSQVRDLLLSYGQQVGLDRAKLGVCYDSQASKSRVDAGRKEGEDLGVNQTPTVYINGRYFPGPPPEVFVQAVEDALAEVKQSSPRASR